MYYKKIGVLGSFDQVQRMFKKYFLNQVFLAFLFFFLIFLIFFQIGRAEASMLVYQGEEDFELKSNKIILDANDTGGDVTLQFGTTLNEVLNWDNTNGLFVFSDDVLVTGNITVGSSTETIDSDGGSFTLSGDDVFVADSLGVEGNIYTDSTATKYQFLDIYGCVRGSASTGAVAGGQVAVVRFDAVNNSQMRCALPVPDDWQSGTDVTATIFWSASDNTAGDLDFDFNYAAFAVGETMASGSFTDAISTTPSIAINSQLALQNITVTIPSAALAADDMLNFRFRRQPTDATDTYAADVNIHLIRIEYTGKKLF